MPRLLVAIVFGILVKHATAETLVMEAPEGKYDAGAIGDLSEVSKISTAFRVTKQSKNLQWPPAAYVGFYQGTNRNDSFQFLVIKDRNVGATEMAVGYRVIEGGKEKKVAYLATIEASVYANVELGFNQGEVTIRYEKQKPITVKTHLKKATPYVAVSSGTAEFKMHP